MSTAVRPSTAIVAAPVAALAVRTHSRRPFAMWPDDRDWFVVTVRAVLVPPATSAPPWSRRALARAAIMDRTQSSTLVGLDVLAIVPMVLSAPSFDAGVVDHADSLSAVPIACSYFCAATLDPRMGFTVTNQWWLAAPVRRTISPRIRRMPGQPTASRFSAALGNPSPVPAST